MAKKLKSVGNGGLRGWWELKGDRGWKGMRGLQMEVHATILGLYQVTNWSYGQKTQKKRGRGKWWIKGDGRVERWRGGPHKNGSDAFALYAFVPMFLT